MSVFSGRYVRSVFSGRYVRSVLVGGMSGVC